MLGLKEMLICILLPFNYDLYNMEIEEFLKLTKYLFIKCYIIKFDQKNILKNIINGNIFLQFPPIKKICPYIPRFT